MTSPRIVILGGAGMLGHKMFQKLRARFPDTMCTIRGGSGDCLRGCIDRFRGSDVICDVDVYDFDRLSRTLGSLRPQFVINCVGVIKQTSEASSPIPAITLNALLPHRLAKLCTEWDGRLIHFSTDCVFSGRRGMYKEEDASDAEDLYGKSKFLGETQEANALTLRTSIIGRELSRHKSLLDWFLSQAGGSVRGYTKAIYSGVTTNHMASVTGDIIERRPCLQGLYQVASEPISKCQLLYLLRDAYGLDVAIEPVDGENVDRSLNGSKFNGELGYRCPSWTSLVDELAKDPTPYKDWLNK